MYREVALVLAENLERTKEEYAKVAFSDVHVIPYREFYLIHIYANSVGRITRAREAIAIRGIALNAVAMDDDSRTSSLSRWHYICRFDALGTAHQQYQPPKDELSETTRSLLNQQPWPDGAKGRMAELRAYCISQNMEWDNQTQYGQLYTMMQLLGAED
jgi:hypothetical protein